MEKGHVVLQHISGERSKAESVSDSKMSNNNKLTSLPVAEKGKMQIQVAVRQAAAILPSLESSRPSGPAFQKKPSPTRKDEYRLYSFCNTERLLFPQDRELSIQ